MIWTAESVSRVHPDKVCDQISDAILDACIAKDPNSRVAIEVMGGHGMLAITGELTTKAAVDEARMADIAREIYRDCGYSDELEIVNSVDAQSPEIAAGVDNDGAGDQGVMVGYATAETPELMPREIVLVRNLVREMKRHDGKAQISIDNGQVVSLLTSLCVDDGASDVDLEGVVERDIRPLLSREKANLASVWIRDPSGEWKISGFSADAGLTGRKIVVDSYGPRVPVGGGAYAGKDPTKVDRSGACMARKIAVDYVTKKGAQEVYVYLAYSIARPEPFSATVIADGVVEPVREYDLRPRAIIETLALDRPGYIETARYGHFGNGFSWDT
jgi:S-adenosylmethionine synthetase